MSREEQIIRQFSETAGLYICETRSAMITQENDVLSFAELSFLLCVDGHEQSNAVQIASFLGMTRGAVTQQAARLKKRGYLHSYKQEGNKKEVFYLLTDKGTDVLSLARKERERINRQVADYLTGLSGREMEAVEGFLSRVAEAVEIKKECYMQMKNSEQGRCEKCKIHY